MLALRRAKAIELDTVQKQTSAETTDKSVEANTMQEQDAILESSKIISDQELIKMLATVGDTFQAIDVAFHGLRTIFPTDKEREETKMAINILDRKWKELGMKATPKFELTKFVALRHQELYPVAYLGEDFVERGHQDGKKERQRTSCTRSYKQAQMSSISFRTAQTNYHVQMYGQNAIESRKRKFKNVSKGEKMMQ